MEQKDIEAICGVIEQISPTTIAKSVFDFWLLLRGIMYSEAIYSVYEIREELFDALNRMSIRKRALLRTAVCIAKYSIRDSKKKFHNVARLRQFLTEADDVFCLANSILGKNFDMIVLENPSITDSVEHALRAASYLDMMEYKIMKLSDKSNKAVKSTALSAYKKLKGSRSIDDSERITKETRDDLYRAKAPKKLSGWFNKIGYFFKKIFHLLRPKPMSGLHEYIEESRFLYRPRKKYYPFMFKKPEANHETRNTNNARSSRRNELKQNA